MASRLLNAPVALVSLVGAGSAVLQKPGWAGRAVGDASQTPLSHSFCRHVVASGRPLCVGDAPNDPRVCDNPAITDMNVAAYLGVPLVTPEGQVLGAFCVLDGQPRAWTGELQALLRDLADSVQTEIVLRQAARLAERERREKTVLLDSAEQGILGADANGHCTFVNPAAGRRLGYAPHELVGHDLHALVHPCWPDGSPCLGDQCPLAHAIQNGLRGRFDDLTLFCRDGAAFPAIVACAPTSLSEEERAGDVSEISAGTATVVSFWDITERRRAEQRLRAQYAVSRVLAEAEALDGGNTVPRLLEAVARGVGWNCAAFWRVQAGLDEPDEQNGSGRLRCAGVWHAPAHQWPVSLLPHSNKPSAPARACPAAFWPAALRPG
jgi:PAS domain-containing protein